MFVYQNKNGDICITFEDNKPVDNPEYVITVDKDAKTISLNGGETLDVENNNTAELEGQIAELTTALNKANTTIADLEARIAELEDQGKETEV